MASLVGKELELRIEGTTYQVRIDELSPEAARVTVNGRALEVAILAQEQESEHEEAPGSPPPPRQERAASPVRAAPRPSKSKNTLNALMPGVVVRLEASEGQEVAAGDVLLILEAMKMENEIRSDRAGIINKIHVSVGQQVQTGDPLLSFS